jgi:hypothetical protein
MSDKSRPKLIPQPHGGALQIGNPGNKGGAGRPPNELRKRLRDGLEGAIPSILEAAADPDHPHYRWAVEISAKYGLGTQFQITGDEDAPVKLDVDAMRTQILALLPRQVDDEESGTAPRLALPD